jgi:hypothetical protein
VPTRHEELFTEYVQALRQAKIEAEEWWTTLLDAETRRASTLNQAVVNLKRRWPVGPASHPYVIAVLRKFFLACEALNDELADAGDEDEEVYPHTFVSEWLLDDETDDLADFMGDLTYWPIGLDSDGDFV